MKRLKSFNQKAELVDHALASGQLDEVYTMQTVAGCASTLILMVLAMLILFKLGESQAGSLITLAVGIFILPSIFLSALGGQIADAHDRHSSPLRCRPAAIVSPISPPHGPRVRHLRHAQRPPRNARPQTAAAAADQLAKRRAIEHECSM